MKNLELSSSVSSTNAAPTQEDYLADATRAYVVTLDKMKVAAKYADSAFTVLQRELQRTDDPAARERALSELTVASTTAGYVGERMSQHVSDITNAIVASTSTPPDFIIRRGERFGVIQVKRPASPMVFQVPSEDVTLSYSDVFARMYSDQFISGYLDAPQFPPVPLSERSVAAETESYWRHIRDDLQAFFNVNLRDLQSLVGIAYPTLVNIGKRKPHPSTARAILQLHTVASHVIRTRGDGPGREWLASVGRRALAHEGFESFKLAAVGEPAHVVPFGGISFGEEPEAVASAIVPEQRARGGRF